MQRKSGRRGLQYRFLSARGKINTRFRLFRTEKLSSRIHSLRLNVQQPSQGQIVCKANRIFCINFLLGLHHLVFCPWVDGTVGLPVFSCSVAADVADRQTAANSVVYSVSR